MRRLFEELRQRRVFRTAALYLVVAWVAVEVGATVFPLLGLGEWAPRLVLALAAAGLPVALALAWRFDLRQGELRADDPDVDPRHVRVGQATVVAAAVLVGLAVPIFLWLDRSSTQADPPVATAGEAIGAPSPDPTERSRTVAVLPFSEPGADGDAAFANGIADELVLALARYEGIRVLSRAAAARLLGQGRDPEAVARDLGAGFLLEGTVWRGEDSLRVRTSLTEAETFEVRWSDDLTRELSVENLFDVQRRVANAVAGELRAELLPDPSPRLSAAPTSDLAAFEHYLRGNAALARRTPASVQRAIAEFRAAAERDADFAAAKAREAYALSLFIDWEWNYPGAGAGELRQKALGLAREAIEADSASADAWLGLAYAGLMADRDRPQASLPAFERALALNPGDAEAYHQYGQTLMITGRYPEAMAAYHGALALDPGRAVTLVSMSAISARTRDREQARRWADSAVVVGGDVPYAWAVRAHLQNALGDHEGARTDAERSLAIDPSYEIPARTALAGAWHGLEDPARERLELERALSALADREAPGQTDAYFIGKALVSVGSEEDAVAFIERASPRSAWLWFYLQHPGFDPVRDRPRFERVVREADPRAASK